METLGKAFDAAVAEILIASAQKDVPLAQFADSLKKTRNAIFFDEEVPLIVLLRFSTAHTEDQIKSLSAGVTINVDATVSEVAESADASAGRKAPGQLVFSERLTPGCLLGVIKDTETVMLAWSSKIFIPFVKARTGASRTTFNVTLNYEPSIEACQIQNAYMIDESEASDLNILQSLCNDADLGPHGPRLSASRLLTLSSARTESAQVRLRKHARRTFPCKSAISLRIQSTFLPHANRALVSLEIEASVETDKDKWVEVVEMTALTSDGSKVSALGAPLMPLRLRAREQLSLVYELSPSQLSTGPTIPAEFLMLLQPNVSTDALGNSPEIRSKWATIIRIRPDEPPQHGKRPTSQVVSPKGQPPGDRLSRRISTQSTNSSRAAGHPFEGIQLKITTPTGCLLGETITVSLAVSNQTNQHKALLVQVPQSTQGSKQLPMLPTSNDQRLSLQGRQSLRTAVGGDVDLICLTNEVRVGPLAPKAMRLVQLQFIAMNIGMMRLRDIRVIDLQTAQAVDVQIDGQLLVRSGA
ncbi:TRAPP trafficking subunit Trs65-domain-containing protein [Protomyces lactucae-debilis]|uniref:TRAPP trafficking subunit Trs65-domain-containing protein n=1 Tax=Protomyces lactucae-debilis TaxID=2754530 RepID=A0A1Y2FV12_PROLT|nr:TRAPP trafficking subunit Trs65-domain-containing protein [Protomyces lactucae-debilis]ORY87134.1 TRAPP trafficking subunit Trs65-domain-containing protein [Protomyces lactucae-debilis]